MAIRVEPSLRRLRLAFWRIVAAPIAMTSRLRPETVTPETRGEATPETRREETSETRGEETPETRGEETPETRGKAKLRLARETLDESCSGVRKVRW